MFILLSSGEIIIIETYAHVDKYPLSLVVPKLLVDVFSYQVVVKKVPFNLGHHVGRQVTWVGDQLTHTARPHVAIAVYDNHHNSERSHHFPDP